MAVRDNASKIFWHLPDHFGATLPPTKLGSGCDGRAIRAGGARLNFIRYNVETRATPAMAWDVFADWTLWPRFSDWYGSLRWTQGEPWKKGSRLRIEILR